MDIKKIKNFVFLHLSILLYSVTTILSKYASRFEFLSFKYILIFALIILNLGIYAIIWQQVIKLFSASVGYSNKSVTIIWVLLISVFIFGEGITVWNIIGSIIIISGIVLVVKGDD